jgi:phosphoribosylpyrophosphate synthetase
MENGAKSVRAIISHGVLSGPAMERIGESVLKELVISDSLTKKESLELCEEDYSEDKCTDIINGCNKIKIISVTRQIGLAVKAIITETSYESLRGENK